MPKASSKKTTGNQKRGADDIRAENKALNEQTKQLVREGRLKVVIGPDGKEYVEWANEEPQEMPREAFERAEHLRVRTFLKENIRKDLPWPPQGLNATIESDNGKLRMWVEVRCERSFGQAVQKAWPDLRCWRERLTNFDRRPRWEELPHPITIIVAKSKKGGACLEWMKTADPGMAKRISRERGNGLSPGQLSKELNQTIETWLTSYTGPLSICDSYATVPPPMEERHGRNDENRLAYFDAVAVLVALDFTWQAATTECKRLLEGIREGRHPFHKGRAKYCRPVRQAKLVKLINKWSTP